MRNLLWLTVLLTTVLPVGATVKNPMIRVCLVQAGQFFNLESEGQEIQLCRFGLSFIGAETLQLYKSNQSVPMAVEAFYSAQSQDSATKEACFLLGAKKINVRGDQFGDFFVCQFPDNSILDEKTLILGHGSRESQPLDFALKERY
jgi:hypothetical protein